MQSSARGSCSLRGLGSLKLPRNRNIHLPRSGTTTAHLFRHFLRAQLPSALSSLQGRADRQAVVSAPASFVGPFAGSLKESAKTLRIDVRIKANLRARSQRRLFCKRMRIKQLSARERLLSMRLFEPLSRCRIVFAFGSQPAKGGNGRRAKLRAFAGRRLRAVRHFEPLFRCRIVFAPQTEQRSRPERLPTFAAALG